MKKIVGFHLRSMQGTLICILILWAMILIGYVMERATLPDHAGFFVWLAASMEVIVVLAEMETMLYGPPCHTMFLLPFSRRQIVSALLMTKVLLAGAQTLVQSIALLCFREPVAHLVSIAALGCFTYLCSVLYFLAVSIQRESTWGKGILLRAVFILFCLALGAALFLGWTDLPAAIALTIILLGTDIALSVRLIKRASAC